MINNGEVHELAPVSNGGKHDILLSVPYSVEVQIEGAATLLLHAWNIEAIAEKAASKKGSAAKKSDNVESYVNRCEDGTIGIPGKYLIGSLINPKNGAAKYLQDPRSPRKSAVDLFKAGVICTTEIASLGKKEWDYIDQQRVTVQHAGITRCRPAFKKGWSAVFQLEVLLPEYIPEDLLLSALVQAGKFCGVGDFRPTYGRFGITKFEKIHLA